MHITVSWLFHFGPIVECLGDASGDPSRTAIVTLFNYVFEGSLSVRDPQAVCPQTPPSHYP